MAANTFYSSSPPEVEHQQVLRVDVTPERIDLGQKKITVKIVDSETESLITPS